MRISNLETYLINMNVTYIGYSLQMIINLLLYIKIMFKISAAKMIKVAILKGNMTQ